jgi:hypothetical protein
MLVDSHSVHLDKMMRRHMNAPRVRPAGDIGKYVWIEQRVQGIGRGTAPSPIRSAPMPRDGEY